MENKRYSPTYVRTCLMAQLGRQILDGVARSLPAGCPPIVPGCAKYGADRSDMRDAVIDMLQHKLL